MLIGALIGAIISSVYCIARDVPFSAWAMDCVACAAIGAIIGWLVCHAL